MPTSYGDVEKSTSNCDIQKMQCTVEG